jgi:hypothetical protein
MRRFREVERKIEDQKFQNTERVQISKEALEKYNRLFGYTSESERPVENEVPVLTAEQREESERPSDIELPHLIDDDDDSFCGYEDSERPDEEELPHFL